MTYEEAVRYLDSFINYEKRVDYSYSKEILGLKRINLLLEKLDNPHKNLRAIHIAGSKGKGSVASFCASILEEAGFKTGLYTSPHLETFRERIRINGELISEEEVVEFIEVMKPHIEKINYLSFFEIYTALAFLYFKRKRVDLVVVEVGLGGRLDATNVINPLVCCITPISFEHTQKLGNTLKSIAREKSDIIKDKSFVVSSPQKKEALEVIKEKAKEAGVRLIVVGENIFYHSLKNEDLGQIFFCIGIFGEYGPLKINMIGEHQVINATTAIGAMEALRFHSYFISKEAIKRGLLKTRWPGRMEVVNKEPFTVLDGAQNVASALALREAIRKHFSYQRLILVLGISKDKDIPGIVKILEAIADEVIITRANLARAAEPEFIASFFDKDKKIRITHSVREAIKRAKGQAKKNDLILICGSLFVVGEARRELRMQG